MSCGILFHKTQSKFWQLKCRDTQSAQAEWIGDKTTQLSFAAKMDQIKCSVKNTWGRNLWNRLEKKTALFGDGDSSNS